jgi:hypothetical protein
MDEKCIWKDLYKNYKLRLKSSANKCKYCSGRKFYCSSYLSIEEIDRREQARGLEECLRNYGLLSS